MSQIIYATEKVRTYDGLKRLCEYAGKSDEWCSELWIALLADPQLYREFVYYLEHHAFADHMKVEGYSLTDFYVWQMERHNLINDTGKNTEACNKEAMVLQAFWTMTEIKKEPAGLKRRLEEGSGMDRE